MTRPYALRPWVSAVALASVAILIPYTLRLWSAGVLPVVVQQQGNGLYVLHRTPDFALPAPLVDGDILAPREMTPTARAAVNYGVGLPVGSSVGIAVLRGGHVVQMSIAARPPAPFARDWLSRLVNAFVFVPCLAALALLTLWRGRDRVAAGLCVVSLCWLVGSALLQLANIMAEPLLAFWLLVLVLAAQFAVALPAMYVIAEGLAGRGMTDRTRKLARATVAGVALVALVLTLAREISFTYAGLTLSGTVQPAINLLSLILLAIPVWMLVAGYRKAPHESRLRIRWVLWSTAFLLVCMVVIIALEPVQDRHPYLFEFFYTIRLFALGGYLYAAIRTRLVDVSFVVNRALVYAMITGLLFGIFSVLELGLHDLAVSDKLSWALQAIAALLLAVALSPLHRRLEHWVERAFFRKQRLAIASVRNFAAECAFIEQQSHLLDTAVERLHPHCDAVAIYERTLSGYQLRASRGCAWPDSVDVDDPAFVSMRAHRQEVDLHGLASAMGPDSFAFPMTVGESLSGAVICHPRAGERLAPDIRAALSEAARNLGASLYILRYREQARLVADIATGRIDESGARQRAMAMLQGAA